MGKKHHYKAEDAKNMYLRALDFQPSQRWDNYHQQHGNDVAYESSRQVGNNIIYVCCPEGEYLQHLDKRSGAEAEG